MKPRKTTALEEENGKVAMLVEGACSIKLGFGIDVTTNEGKGSKEKK
jgi:hypothetical protein